MVDKCIDTAVDDKPGAVSGQQLFDTICAWQNPDTWRVGFSPFGPRHPAEVERLHRNMNRLDAKHLATFGGEAFKAIINAAYPRDPAVAAARAARHADVDPAAAEAAAAAAFLARDAGGGAGAGAGATSRGRVTMRSKRGSEELGKPDAPKRAHT